MKIEIKLDAVKECIRWAAQQSYTDFEKAAKEIENLTGEKLVEDQPYYNSYRWEKKTK